MRFLNPYIIVLRFVFFAAAFFTYLKADAQKYPFVQYDADNGLPSSDIFHVFQDSKGYIWIATDNGVSRFNGYEFVNYGIADGLPHNTIFEIFEDSKGRIWFVSARSSLSYYKDGKIFPYQYNYLLQDDIKRRAIPVKYSFFVDSLTNVYITTEGKRTKWVDANGNLKKILPDSLLFKHNFILKRNNRLIMTFLEKNVSDSIFYLENNLKTILYVKDLPHYYIKHFNAIKLGQNKLLFALGKKVYEFTKDKLSKIYTFDEKIYWIQKDSNNNIWIAGHGGGVKRYPKGKLDKKPDIFFLKDYYISSVLEDKNGGFWFSTLHNGLHYLPALNIRYYNKKGILYKNNVNVVYAQNDSLWIGYHTNYVSLIYKTSVKHIQIDKKINNEITSIYFDPAEKGLIVGATGGLYVVKNGKSKNYISRTIKPDVLTKDLFIAGPKDYWVAGRAGFYHIKNRKVIFNSQKEKNFNLRTNAIYADEKNNVWIGSTNGLWKYKNNYLEYMGNKEPLFTIRVLNMTMYRNKLTLGTQGGGIIILDKDSVWQINTKSGIGSNHISSITVSGKYLWVGTKKGLSRIYIDDNKSIDILNYTKSHGLLTNEIRNLFAQDSFLYISSNKGLMRLNVNHIKKDTTPVPLYFKEISINHKKVALQKKYHLKYNQNNIAVKYEALMFGVQNSANFRYMMIGLDSSCTQTNAKELRFSFLPPGNYTLELTTKNKDGFWNKNSKKIIFIIEKPYWEKTWFIVLIVLLTLSFIYLFIRIKTKQIHKKNQMQRELNIYIKQALVNHMNPHFMFNSLSLINKLILENDKEKASEYLTRFSRLMRGIIENSKKEFIPIYEEIKSNRMYLEIEASRMEHQLDYEFIIDKKIDQFNTKVPSLLIQPFIENAIWYGIQPSDKKGKIIIRIQKNENNLRIEIEDNGIGREKSLQMIHSNEVFTNQSKGTEISYKRILLLKQIYGKNTKIEYIDKKGKDHGTIVILNLPLNL